jgi:hypothetical protein
MMLPSQAFQTPQPSNLQLHITSVLLLQGIPQWGWAQKASHSLCNEKFLLEFVSWFSADIISVHIFFMLTGWNWQIPNTRWGLGQCHIANEWFWLILVDMKDRWWANSTFPLACVQMWDYNSLCTFVIVVIVMLCHDRHLVL